MPELKLAVAHVNYNLRKDSERDYLFVRELAEKTLFPCLLIT